MRLRAEGRAYLKLRRLRFNNSGEAPTSALPISLYAWKYESEDRHGFTVFSASRAFSAHKPEGVATNFFAIKGTANANILIPFLPPPAPIFFSFFIFIFLPAFHSVRKKLVMSFLS
jgi:hypothetical protein